MSERAMLAERLDGADFVILRTIIPDNVGNSEITDDHLTGEEHNALVAALAAAQRVEGPTPAEIELMMVDTEHHRAGPVHRSDDGTLRVYYAGFNLTALSEHIARELAQAAPALSLSKVEGELNETAIESAISGFYEMPDHRKFWIDGPVAREITRRMKAALALSPGKVSE